MKLVLSNLAYDKLFTWIDHAKGECSGMGIVKAMDDYFLVTDLFICKQKNSMAETELDPEALAKLTSKVYEDGLVNEAEGTYFKLHWHSHVNMGVFRSGTDNELIKQTCRFGWHLFLIANKKREFHAVYYDPSGSKTVLGEYPLELDKIAVEIEQKHSAEKETWIKELEACEEKPVYTPKFDSYQHVGGIHDMSYDHAWDNESYWKPSTRGFLPKVEKEETKITSKHFDFLKKHGVENVYLNDFLGLDFEEVNELFQMAMEPEDVLIYLKGYTYGK